jgi:hypothetical protein
MRATHNLTEVKYDGNWTAVQLPVFWWFNELDFESLLKMYKSVSGRRESWKRMKIVVAVCGILFALTVKLKKQG